MMGTVGVPITTIEARLESVPELGYDALADVPRGEICLRGKTLFSGYHKRQDLTSDVLVDGWFHTGNLLKPKPLMDRVISYYGDVSHRNLNTYLKIVL
mgnify:FL=1